jgi:hypothetical protein
MAIASATNRIRPIVGRTAVATLFRGSDLGIKEDGINYPTLESPGMIRRKYRKTPNPVVIMTSASFDPIGAVG